MWTSLVVAAAAAYAAARCDSAICTMLAGIAAGFAVLVRRELDLRRELGDDLPLAAARRSRSRFALASLVLRGGHPRHAELMVVTGGLAILAIFLVAALGALFGAVLPFGIAPQSGLLPGFWELVLLVAGCGLVAYGAVDRVPGAAWLGVAQLAGFVIAASAAADETLLWWPLLLLLLGGGALAAGLRPRMPLPPEPAGYSVQRPLASRTDDDEVTVRVRNDEPPSR